MNPQIIGQVSSWKNGSKKRHHHMSSNFQICFITHRLESHLVQMNWVMHVNWARWRIMLIWVLRFRWRLILFKNSKLQKIQLNNNPVSPFNPTTKQKSRKKLFHFLKKLSLLRIQIPLKRSDKNHKLSLKLLLRGLFLVNKLVWTIITRKLYLLCRFIIRIL